MAHNSPIAAVGVALGGGEILAMWKGPTYKSNGAISQGVFFSFFFCKKKMGSREVSGEEN